MWKIKQIFDGDYGCEERTDAEPIKVSVTLENEKGQQKYITVEDEWLIRNHLDTGSIWNDIEERFEFRNIKPEEADQAVHIEQICFPPNEACSEHNMKQRIATAPELFLVAVDKKTGRIAGFLNGLSTDEKTFRDEFFTDASLYNPKGKQIMLLGLDVLPEYRMQGLARELVNQYKMRESKNKREMLILTCLDDKVEMYKKMGFTDKGIADSTWGNEKWHEMRQPL